jgi:hypothetical protein
MPSCVICNDESSVEMGAICSYVRPHFTCKDCLNLYAPTCLEPSKYRMLRGEIPCPGLNVTDEPCTSRPWNFTDLQTFLEPTTTTLFVNKLQAFISTLLDTEGAASAKEKAIAQLKLELQAAAAVADRAELVSGLRTQLIEKYFLLRCPRCYQAFLDYEGCDALKCEKCGCGYCGLCLKDCGNNAHTHVRDTNHAEMSEELRAHSSTDAKRRIHAMLRKSALVEALGTIKVTNDIKHDVIEAMRKDLFDIGINADDVLKDTKVSPVVVAAAADGRGIGRGIASINNRGGVARRNNLNYPPPASKFGGVFHDDAIRYAATDCLKGNQCTMRPACRFRHEEDASNIYCTNWVVSRVQGSSYCELGPACQWAHPYHKSIKLTDCPSCEAGVRARGTPCAYTGGLPSMLRHMPIRPRNICPDFSPPPQSKICPRGFDCPHLHLMTV